MDRLCACGCGANLKGRRSDALYDSAACRKRAERKRVAEAEAAFPMQPRRPPRAVRKPSPNDIGAMFSLASGLAGSFRLASMKSEWKLRPMCSRMADAIEAALEEEGML